MDNYKYALITLSNKDNIDVIIDIVLSNNYIIISTGGTYTKIKSYLINTLKISQDNLHNKLKLVSDITSYPEILNGRVKTLHPKIAGGILSMKDNSSHLNEMKYQNIPYIDVVIVNLYPFKEAISKNSKDLNNAIENIDIGGHTLIRESVKNFKNTLIIVDPNDYQNLKDLKFNQLTVCDRFKFAKKALNHIIDYDICINDYFLSISNIDNLDRIELYSNNDNINNDINTVNNDKRNSNTSSSYSNNFESNISDNIKYKFKNLDKSLNKVNVEDSVIKTKPKHRIYRKQLNLKYGCNSHQDSAGLFTINNDNNPLTILNGNLGYINILDALNGWQLVKELKEATKLSAAASFKHTSPAGVGVNSYLSENQRIMYDVDELTLTPLAIAYIKARYSDPLSSFGDFISLSDTVDECTAKLIKREVSDGVIAPGYSIEALKILKQKKNGNFIIIQVDPSYENSHDVEFREIFGITISQKPNKYKTNYSSIEDFKSDNTYLSDDSKIDLILANISLKYAQSNSIAYAHNGQLIGLGAGQQNRVDCVKIAGEKSRKWILMQHPKLINLKNKFKITIKRQEKINAFTEFINNEFNIYDKLIKGKMYSEDYVNWLKYFKDKFKNIISPFINKDKEDYLKDYYSKNSISMASDAFFPFTDNIDVAKSYGVKNILHPGGSLADEKVINKVNEYNMTLIHSGTRMFYH